MKDVKIHFNKNLSLTAHEQSHTRADGSRHLRFFLKIPFKFMFYNTLLSVAQAARADSAADLTGCLFMQQDKIRGEK